MLWSTPGYGGAVELRATSAVKLPESVELAVVVALAVVVELGLPAAVALAVVVELGLPAAVELTACASTAGTRRREIKPIMMCSLKNV
jgi:hypothetical protein